MHKSPMPCNANGLQRPRFAAESKVNRQLLQVWSFGLSVHGYMYAWLCGLKDSFYCSPKRECISDQQRILEIEQN